MAGPLRPNVGNAGAWRSSPRSTCGTIGESVDGIVHGRTSRVIWRARDRKDAGQKVRASVGHLTTRQRLKTIRRSHGSHDRVRRDPRLSTLRRIGGGRSVSAQSVQIFRVQALNVWVIYEALNAHAVKSGDS